MATRFLWLNKISSRSICLNLTLKRNIAIYSSNQTKNDEKFDENDWFQKLTNSESQVNNNKTVRNQQLLNQTQNSSKPLLKKYQLMTEEEKLEVVQQTWNYRRENGMPAPKVLTEKFIAELLKCEGYSHLNKTIRYFAKEEYYNFQKQQKKLNKENNKEEIKDEEIEEEEVNQSFQKRLFQGEMKKFYRNRILTSILTNEPSIVFDFRYTSMHTRNEHIKSLYKQYTNIINSNRRSREPFQIHFCNYDIKTEFHNKYEKFLDLDTNLILDSSKSYLDLFPKQKLVYLSRDAKDKMIRYDPDKVYIVGSMIDHGSVNQFKLLSYSQAKKDGIRCERLPLDDHIKWNQGQKNLTMDHVFNILLNLKLGYNWKESLVKSLPSRNFSEIPDTKYKNVIFKC